MTDICRLFLTNFVRFHKFSCYINEGLFLSIEKRLETGLFMIAGVLPVVMKLRLFNIVCY